MNKRELQEIEKEKNIEISIRMCLIENKTIPQIAEFTRLSTSTIQRYLNDRYIVDRYGVRTAQAIKIKLACDKIKGNRLGGINYSKYNEPTRDSSGLFTGSKSK